MNQDDDGWIYSLGPREGKNLIIRNFIYEHCRLHQAMEREADPENYQIPPLDKKETDKRITCFFHSQKRKFRDINYRTVEQIAEKRIRSGRRSRLSRVSKKNIRTRRFK